MLANENKFIDLPAAIRWLGIRPLFSHGTIGITGNSTNFSTCGTLYALHCYRKVDTLEMQATY